MTDKANEEEIVIPKVEDFIEEEKIEEVEVSETEAPSIEDQARDMGWVPETEFDGDKAKWVPAKEFVDRAPLYDAIHKTKRELKQVREALDALKTHHKSVWEKAREKAIAEYEAAIAIAAEQQDIKKFHELNKQKEVVESKTFEGEVDPEPTTTAPTAPAEYTEWAARNQWYEKDEDLNLEATIFGTKLAQKQQQLPEDQRKTYTEILEETAIYIKKKYPEKFKSPSKARATTVSQTSPSGKATGKVDYMKVTRAQLPEEIRQVYDRLVRSGIMKHEDYIKEYLAIGGSLES